MARVLHKAIGALVVSHFDEGDHVHKQARALAGRDAAIKQVNGRWNLRKDRLERVMQQVEAREFRAAQIADHVGSLGLLDARLAHGGLQARRNIMCVRIVHMTSVAIRTLTQRELYRLGVRPPHEHEIMVSAYA